MSCASGSNVFCQENPERGGGSHTGSQRDQSSTSLTGTLTEPSLSSHPCLYPLHNLRATGPRAFTGSSHPQTLLPARARL